MFIKGFGFSGYRSIGDNLVKLSPLKKINFIIGQNNSGKSNLINFLFSQYPSFLQKIKEGRRGEKISFSETDLHISNKKAEHRISFYITRSDIDEYITNLLPDFHQSRAAGYGKKVLLSHHFCNGSEIEFVYKYDKNEELSLNYSLEAVKDVLTTNEWQILWSTLTGQSGGGLLEHWIPESIKRLFYAPNDCPAIEIIPAIRKVGGSGSEATDFSGNGIIERLAKIQNPSLRSQKDKLKFSEINKFLSSVLENSSASIEIPHARDMILVHMDGKTLPLESLGTGVHEVIILAAAATILENSVLCIEEPELHLHPLLQRKLVSYLQKNTNNQYFFTTHSAHLLDAVEAEIFHVTQTHGATEIEAISSTKQRSEICNNLGYKASDILQANCVIWVEGPSDRIYLNYWIKSLSDNFIEGVHYSIMFYGGRLFSHLSASDSADDDYTDDLISIRKLNKNSAIIFDSDKPTKNARLSLTKQRLKNEFDLGPGFAWVTQGREIENYLDEEQVKIAVLTVHPSAKSIEPQGQWANLLKYVKSKSGEPRDANKVKVAQYYTEQYPANLNKLDLKTQIQKVRNFILASNQINT